MGVTVRMLRKKACFRRFMHPISLVSDADSDDNADVDGEKHSQPKHHRGSQRRSMKQDLLDSIMSLTC